MAPGVPGEVMCRRVLRCGGACPPVALVVGRGPARAELGQLRALARLPRPHAGGHDAFYNKENTKIHMPLKENVHINKHDLKYTKNCVFSFLQVSK